MDWEEAVKDFEQVVDFEETEQRQFAKAMEKLEKAEQQKQTTIIEELQERDNEYLITTKNHPVEQDLFIVREE